MMGEQRHFLVVGAGLSGITVAMHLLERGQEVSIIDSGENHSSEVAAGLINPVVFRRMAKSWRVDDFLPYALAFYKKMEASTGIVVFSPLIIRRLFSHEQERDFWLRYQNDPGYTPYLEPLRAADDAYNLAINQFGTGRVKGGGICQPEAFMEAGRQILNRSVHYLVEEFKHELLEQVTYKGVKYTDIIFCEGYRMLDNPWFKYLPLIQTKGEMLIIKAELPRNESLNRKCFILPQADDTFRVGSTYMWHTADLNPSERGKEMILENLAYVSHQDIEILDQQVGIRPTTHDRRPFIGTHPDYQHYHLFNGMGTKGYLNAPLLAKEFVGFLLDGDSLDPELSIERI